MVVSVLHGKNTSGVTTNFICFKRLCSEKNFEIMKTPTLDLHGLRHHEVANAVARFIESHLAQGFLRVAPFIDIITGNSNQMLFEAVKVVQQYGLEYMTGLPYHQGRIRVVMYDEYH